MKMNNKMFLADDINVKNVWFNLKRILMLILYLIIAKNGADMVWFSFSLIYGT